jgi:hypothetical protein
MEYITSSMDFSLNLKYDNSGKSMYTEEDKKKMLLGFLSEVRIYTTKLNPKEQKSTSAPDGSVEYTGEVSEGMKTLMITSLVYNLFMFGSWKYGTYILFGKQSEDYLWMDVTSSPYSSGIMQSVLSRAISKVPEYLPNARNNLEKLLMNNGYQLDSSEKRKNFFGKGHLNLVGQEKINAKKDLQTIFAAMMDNKVKIKESGVSYRIEFEKMNLNYFRLIKYQT